MIQEQFCVTGADGYFSIIIKIKRIQNGKGFILVIMLIFIGYSSFSQTDICDEAAVGVFWPIKIGVKRHYYSRNGSYVSYFNGDSSIFSGHVYYKRIEEYSNNDQKVRYVREQKGNVYIFDTEKNVEFLELSANVTPGHFGKSMTSPGIHCCGYNKHHCHALL